MDYKLTDELVYGEVTRYYGLTPYTLFILDTTIVTLGVLGVAGNIVSMVIWSRPELKSSTSVLLTALAASDLVLIITTSLTEYILVLYYNFHSSPSIAYVKDFIYPYLDAYNYGFYATAQTISVYLTVAITIERYVVVCRPFQARIVCTPSRSFKYVVAIITVSILYNLVTFFQTEVVAEVDKAGNILYYISKHSDLMRIRIYNFIVDLHSTWLHLIMISLLPFVCIAILNTCIYLEMKRTDKRRHKLTTAQQKENRLTRMLVYVLGEFLVCQCVELFYSIILILKLSEKQLGFKPLSLYSLSMFFSTFNSSSNVLTYFMFSSGFRKSLLDRFNFYRSTDPMRSTNKTDSGRKSEECQLRVITK